MAWRFVASKTRIRNLTSTRVGTRADRTRRHRMLGDMPMNMVVDVKLAAAAAPVGLDAHLGRPHLGRLTVYRVRTRIDWWRFPMFLSGRVHDTAATPPGFFARRGGRFLFRTPRHSARELVEQVSCRVTHSGD